MRRVRHVAERFQPAPQHPPPEHQQREQREGEHHDLHRDQLFDGLLDVLHRSGAHQHHPRLHLAAPQPVGALAVDPRGAHQLGVGVRHGPREVGHRPGVVGHLGGLAQRDRVVGGDVVHGRVPAVVRLALDRAVRRRVLGLHGLDQPQLVGQLPLQILVHVRGQGRADHREHRERQHPEAQRQPGAQPHPPVGVPQSPHERGHSAACRMTYPKPRTVWIKGAPVASSLRRSRLTTSSTTLERPPKPYSHT